MLQHKLSAAFEAVDTAILLSNLRNIDIGGIVQNWVASYLQLRRFQLLVEEDLTDVWCHVYEIATG